MKKFMFTLVLAIFWLFCATSTMVAQKKQVFPSKTKGDNNEIIDTRIDNMRYWRSLAKKGLVPLNPEVNIPKGVNYSSRINAKSVLTEDSPDVPVTSETSTQSENSIFIDPSDNTFVMNSNNSTAWSGSSVGSLYGSNYFYSDDEGINWGGFVEGAGGGNSGDPTTAISLDGRMYIGFIHSNGGQGVSYSTNGGTTWTSVQAGPSPGGFDILDKNHLWIDNSPTSTYEGNLYNAWTAFGNANANEIEIVYSDDGGLSYSTPANISSAVSAGSHNQGVHLQTGPNGEVYAFWAIYDSWPSRETAIGMSKSTDGGATFSTASRIITNIKGIRGLDPKSHRVNSFPVSAVDISGGDHNGNVYIVWANEGEPGVNTGTNVSCYLVKSTDGGNTWSDAIRINQGPLDNGKFSYFPWITCDPETGILSVVFYDDRNVSASQAETWVANSYDGGETWEDFRVSDVAFTPNAIPGLAGGYMGDYLGIAARGSKVYPVWTDNRDGVAMTYVSPFETNNRAKPTNLQIALNEETGETTLTWDYSEKTLQHFVVYINNVEIGTTQNQTYTDYLPNYGVFQYKVTAMHEDGESSAASNSIQWGHPEIAVDQTSVEATIGLNQTAVRQFNIENTGELDLEYNISTAVTSDNTKTYCDASGGCDEYISRVVFGDIDNTSACDGYADYSTSHTTTVTTSETYQITVENGNTYPSDDLGVWVDWNQDGDFDDAGEEMVCESGNSGQGTYDIVVPSNALPGQTVMRVRIKYSGEDCGSPCGSTSYGEVEDYGINVLGWITLDSYEGTVAPGNSNTVNVTFDSENLTVGVYNADIIITSNAQENPSVTIPATLTVDGDAILAVAPVAAPQAICDGGSSELNANASGGSGAYTYSWTSDPAGFTSTDAIVTVSPSETTTYTVEVNDGSTTISGSATVTVLGTPGVAATPNGDTHVQNDGQNTPYTTTGADDATSYEWMIEPSEAGIISGSGTTGIVNWTNDYLGTANISVRGVNDCGTGEFSDTFEVTVIDNLGIEETTNEISMVIYPNPTQGKFMMELNSKLEDNISIEIFNSVGIKVYESYDVPVWAKKSMILDISGEPTGLYFVHVKSEDVHEVRKVFMQ